MTRFTRRHLGGLALAAGALSSPALAQEYPTRPITIVVAWPPGSGIDVMVRIMMDALREELGQTIVVDNRGGAAGVIGNQTVANAAPDGYTLLFTSSALNMVSAMGTRTTYEPTDFVPVANVAWTPSILVAHPSLGVKNAQELIAYARARPGQLFYATAGVGAPSHYITELFRVRTGIEATAVPFRGSPQAMAEQIAGRVHFSVQNSSTGLPQIRQGTVVPLGITGRSRLPQLPDVPTLEEQGLDGFAVASYFNGLLAPKGTPLPIAERVADAVNKVLARPAIRERFVPTGNAIDGQSSPEKFRQLIAEDMRTWAEVARAANIKAE
ncbi:MAG TPA: tripartite tricarboxylate transporter substrate binding protein [Falsiroseomonas sp.]|jgi:tripartite-type tricarboxylate transporter receptor subunit TctC|nr:tripartite tricarboxylate transporter substrate binding protein [Falsiroseomonas sp.]